MNNVHPLFRKLLAPIRMSDEETESSIYPRMDKCGRCEKTFARYSKEERICPLCKSRQEEFQPTPPEAG